MRPRVWTALFSDQSLGPTTQLFDFEKNQVIHRNAFSKTNVEIFASHHRGSTRY